MVDVEGEYQQRVDIAKGSSESLCLVQTLTTLSVRALMNPNVVMVIGSAPTFPHGCIDDIESLSAVVQQWPHAGLHVDTCLGGFILPWCVLRCRCTEMVRLDYSNERVSRCKG